MGTSAMTAWSHQAGALSKKELRKRTDSALQKRLTRRLMKSLGYGVSKTPTGKDAYFRTAEYRGKQVTVWLMTHSMEAPPASLLDPVWAGYYAASGAQEMLHDEQYPDLMSFLGRKHSESELEKVGLHKETS